MADDPTWDFLNPASKGRILDALQREADDLFEFVSEPAHWHAPTACEGWQVRDMVGHLVDATESYVSGFDIARRGGAADAPVGVKGMAQASDAAARAFRRMPRVELLELLREETVQLLQELQALSDADWSGLSIPDRYLGPLPATIVATGSLGGSVVHGWDVRQGLGIPHALTADAADLLVPFVFLLWQATADTAAVSAPFAIGIRTTGHNGGDTRIDVSAEGLRYAPGDLDECGAILELDPATLVLTAYNRVNAGGVRGDRQLAARFRSLFVSV